MSKFKDSVITLEAKGWRILYQVDLPMCDGCTKRAATWISPRGFSFMCHECAVKAASKS